MSTTTDTITPTEAPALESVSERGSRPFDQDGSFIADPAKAESALKSVDTAVSAWLSADTSAGAATLALCNAIFDLREQCIRGDNKDPDWAGKTAAYRFVFEDRIREVYRRAGLSESQVTRLNTNARGMIRDRGMRDMRIADYLRRTDSAIAAKVTPDDIAPGKPLSGVLRKAVNKAKGKQTTAKGEILTGFEPAATPTVFGPPKTTGNRTQPGAGNTGQATAQREFDALNSRLSVPFGDKEKPAIAAAESTSQLHRLLTALSKQLTGLDGEKQPTGVTEKKQAAINLRELSKLALLTADYIDSGDGPKPDRAKIAELYWQG